MSVDGDNWPMGALTHLPHASPETITETTPGATVTLTQSLQLAATGSCSVTAVTPLDVVRLDLGRDRGQGQVLARE